MSCNLTKGFALGCTDSIGGIRNIYIAIHGQVDFDSAINDNGVTATITAGTNGDKIFKYAVEQEVANYTETIVSDRSTGTHHFEQTVTLALNKVQADVRNQIKLLAQNKLIIFAELNQKSTLSRTIVILGHESGLMLTGGSTGMSGTAFGDRAGHELTFTGKQTEPHILVEDNATIFGADSLTSIVTS